MKCEYIVLYEKRKGLVSLGVDKQTKNSATANSIYPFVVYIRSNEIW